MGSVSLPVTKRLFANSGNRCAFEDCSEVLVRDDGVVVGRICHIRAARENGPRFERSQTDAERHGYANLLLLCPIHHDVIDKGPASAWSVDRLLELKATHESAGLRAPEDDRACLQMLANLAVDGRGVQIGSIRGDVVQVASGDILNYDSITSVGSSSGRDLDRATLRTIVDLVGGRRGFLRDHDFACSFTAADQAPFRDFSFNHRDPQHEFLDAQLEEMRQNLLNSVNTLLDELGTRTYSVEGTVTGEMRTFRVRRIEELSPPRSGGAAAAVEKAKRMTEVIREDERVLNEAADQVAVTYDDLIRAARRALG